MIATVLIGHTSPETAYLVTDYPYGFRLRCQIRYWIETRKGFGQRVVSQTSNPKKPGLVWNKPKAGQYYGVAVLVLTDEKHVESRVLSGYAGEERIDEFERLYADALGTYEKGAIRYLRALNRAAKRVTWEVRPAGECGPEQSPQEQASIMRALVADELRKDPT